MTTVELLHKTAGDLARRLDAANEPQLRRVAAAIAQPPWHAQAWLIR